MRINRREPAAERKILTAMITNAVVLGRVAASWESPGLFKAQWSNVIGSWCVKYYEEHREAPGRAIEGLFERWSRDADDKLVSLVDRYLSSLSDAYGEEQLNADYISDVANEHFNSVRGMKLASEIEADPKSTELLIANYKPIQVNAAVGVHVTNDAEHVQDAISENDDDEVLIHYPGAIGKFFGESLQRDGFVALMGPEKRGKTFWLLDLAWRAMLERRRVAFFEVGDMSQRQIMQRLCARAARRPLRPGIVKVPKEIEFYKDDDFDLMRAETIFDEREYETRLTWQQAWKALQRVQRRKVKSHDSHLRLMCYPSDSVNVDGLVTQLQSWERDDWVPDVVVIDYADILAAPMGAGRELRDQINKTWSQLRGLSQRLHCLVITATQSDAASYKVRTLRRQHFTDDKRKLAHVTGLFGLNVTEAERHQAVTRLNWIARRGEEYFESYTVFAAGCLAIANPCMVSADAPELEEVES